MRAVRPARRSKNTTPNFALDRAGLTRHLRVLESAGLVAREKEGRTHRLRLVARRSRTVTAIANELRDKAEAAWRNDHAGRPAKI